MLAWLHKVVTHLVINHIQQDIILVTRQETVAPLVQTHAPHVGLNLQNCSLTICFEIAQRKGKLLVVSFSSVGGHQPSVDCLRSLTSAKSNNIVWFFCNLFHHASRMKIVGCIVLCVDQEDRGYPHWIRLCWGKLNGQPKVTLHYTPWRYVFLRLWWFFSMVTRRFVFHAVWWSFNSFCLL